jgi:hypothetical protein
VSLERNVRVAFTGGEIVAAAVVVHKDGTIGIGGGGYSRVENSQVTLMPAK